ncbi:MAG: rhodanese-like domain-containing protein [Bacteroidales bacterium]|nr:rhodanese-like domain-containing protein [Bacteroidales bacterium]
MKKFLSYMFIALVIPAVLFTGCKDTVEEKPNKYTVLADYLKAQGTSFDLPAMHATGWAVTAATLNTNIANYYIIDLRSAADYGAKRISGAVNSTLENLLTEAAKVPAGKTIILVCYSGQTAAFAVPALRLSGFPTAVFLKWGMSAWNLATDVWTSKIANIGTTPAHANWIPYVETPPSVATNVTQKIPVINSDNTLGADILKERILAVLKEGPKFVQPSDVLANPGNYFVNNYWTVVNVTTNGGRHIKGAYRINPMTLANNEVSFLDPSKIIVNYCWTGQTSAAVSFYLKVLGYNAQGMQWGVNGLANAALTSNKWPVENGTFPVVP